MNTPSSTITAVGISGSIASMMFLMMAIFFPEVYAKANAYPGAEATIAGFLTTLLTFAFGYFKKETVLK